MVLCRETKSSKAKTKAKVKANDESQRSESEAEAASTSAVDHELSNEVVKNDKADESSAKAESVGSKRPSPQKSVGLFLRDRRGPR